MLPCISTLPPSATRLPRLIARFSGALRVDDFLKSPYGLPMISNSSIQILLKQSPTTIDTLQKTFNLSEEENLEQGKAVLLVNPRVKLSTAEVFAAWDGNDRGPLPDSAPARSAGETTRWK